MKNTTLQTTTLRDKTIVFAKNTKYGINAVTYSNDTQAYKKQNELRSLGIDCYVHHPFGNFSVRYIAIK